jgi:hypothetical protein
VVPTESNVVCLKSQDISSGMKRLEKAMYQFGIRIALGGNFVVKGKAKIPRASFADALRMPNVPLGQALRCMLRKSSGSPRFL